MLLRLKAFPPQTRKVSGPVDNCGEAGRYKDGKCVDKCGPGPQGPGTVCDR